MSATGRGAERRPDDFYATPPATTRALLRHYDVRGKRVIEPGCGTGSILRELVAAKAHVMGIEKDPARAERAQEAADTRVVVADYLASRELNASERVEFAIGNPPFDRALPFVQKALTQAHTVCMLLRLNWLGSKARAAFHEANPCHVRVLDERPAFVASLKCSVKEPACGWRATLGIADPRPKRCPECGIGDVKVTTTDATEYAWFCWEPARRAEWSILRV